MIVAGNNQVFAIAAEVTGTPEGWLLGRFRFVLHGRDCGNWDDEADLRGCYGWLKDFAEMPRRRFEPGLINHASAEVFDRLVRPLERSGDIRTPEFYKDTFSRFHISHLGMSSFDRIVMVLVENQEIQRCLWRETENENIHDDVFPSGHMQQIAGDFCKLLERAHGDGLKVDAESPAPEP